MMPLEILILLTLLNYLQSIYLLPMNPSFTLRVSDWLIWSVLRQSK